ncbi:MAG: hypothetical protein HZB99_02000 [Candidatus Harrisonbacteria bacterium]|nr:hypothetical protein [Candidatus Harrisonbacteria bacterium]
MDHRNRRYPNLTILFASIFLTYVLLRTGVLQRWVVTLNDLDYFGAFVAGIFWTSVFTVVPATAVLALFAENLNLILVSVFAGLGAVLGDFTIFKFIRDELADELMDLFKTLGGEYSLRFLNLLTTSHFNFLMPIIGAIIIASPLPDELGVVLLGIYKVSSWKFISLSFILNTIGIFLLLSMIKVIA